MTCLLSLDSCTAAGSVAVWNNREVHARYLPEPGRQAELLVPEIEALLTAQHMTYAQLDGIVVTVGPGGFTSLRIGLAVARGISLAAARPAFGCSRFTCMADALLRQQGQQVKRLFTVIMAGRGEYYWQSFARDGTVLTEPRADRLETLLAVITPADTVACVDAEAQEAFCPTGAQIRIIPPDAAALAQWAAYYGLERAINDVNIATGLRPLYIRPPDAIVPRPFLSGESV